MDHQTAPRSNSFPATRDMATYTEVFSGVAAMSPTTMTWEANDRPRSAFIEFVTSSYFPVLGIAPSAGRWFDAAYDLVGAGNYAVVSHRTWRTQFGADPEVIGRSVRPGWTAGHGHRRRSRGVQRQLRGAGDRLLAVRFHRSASAVRSVSRTLSDVKTTGATLGRGWRQASPSPRRREQWMRSRRDLPTSSLP